MKKDSKLCNFRLSTEAVECLARLTGTWACSQTEAVTRALLIAEAAVNANSEPNDESLVDTRLDEAKAAMGAAETKYHDPLSTTPPIPRRAESVAQRRAREAKEHAEKLAESDVMARETGRNDIEYDLENVPHQSAFHVALQKPPTVKHHYEVEKRKVKPLTRPHGSTEAKRRREQT